MSAPVYLDKGQYGKVVELLDEKGEKFALKIVNPGNISFTEIDILSRLKSPYLIRSLEPVVESSSLGTGIKMELKENNLKNLDIVNLPPGQIKRIFMSLLYGLECMHQSGFLHLDIKPANCLYTKENNIYTAYLSDFGFSMRCDDPYSGIKKSNLVGTVKYQDYSVLGTSPDYIYDDKSDVWSLGVTFLALLGFKLDQEEIKESNLKTYDFMKEFWDTTNIQKMVQKYLDETKLSELDKLDMNEMIVNMLKKDKQERISSNQFKGLRFFDNNSMENSCLVSRPKEVLYIPYTSSYVIIGINSLRKHFREKIPNTSLDVYFLAVEIFIRIMSKIKVEDDNKENLQEYINISFLTAMKYYKQVKINIFDYKKIIDNPYKIVNYLKGDIAPNRFYSESDYLEDLILIDNIIFRNYNLISFYMYLDTSRILKYFRESYDYQYLEKDLLMTTKDFFDLEVPNMNTENNIENIRDIYSYTDFKKIDFKDSLNNLVTLRGKEENLRLKLVEEIKELSKPEYIDLIKSITESDNVINYFDRYLNDQTENIFKVFINFNEDLVFGIIKENIYGKVETFGDEEAKLQVFLDTEDKPSLLHIIKNENKVVHYYSNYRESLYEYFKVKNIVYQNDYLLETPNFCKIKEFCLIFIIYIVNLTSGNYFNFFVILDNTIKTMLIYTILKLNEMNLETTTSLNS